METTIETKTTTIDLDDPTATIDLNNLVSVAVSFTPIQLLLNGIIAKIREHSELINKLSTKKEEQLQDQVDKLKEELEKCKAETQKLKEDADKNNEEKQQQIEELQNQLQEEMKKANEANEVNQKAMDEANQKNQQAIDEMNQKLNDLLTWKKNVEEEIIPNIVDQISTKQGPVTKQPDQPTVKIEEIERLDNDFNNKINQLKQQIADVYSWKEKIEKRVYDLEQKEKDRKIYNQLISGTGEPEDATKTIPTKQTHSEISDAKLLERIVGLLDYKLGDVNDRINVLENKFSDLNSKLQLLNVKCDNLSTALEQLQQQQEKDQQKIEQLQQQQQQDQQNIEKLQQQQQEDQEKIAELQQQPSKDTEKVVVRGPDSTIIYEIQKNIEGVNWKVHELQKAMDDGNSKIVELRKFIEELRGNLSDTRKNIDLLQKYIQDLEQKFNNQINSINKKFELQQKLNLENLSLRKDRKDSSRSSEPLSDRSHHDVKEDKKGKTPRSDEKSLTPMSPSRKPSSDDKQPAFNQEITDTLNDILARLGEAENAFNILHSTVVQLSEKVGDQDVLIQDKLDKKSLPQYIKDKADKIDLNNLSKRVHDILSDITNMQRDLYKKADKDSVADLMRGLEVSIAKKADRKDLELLLQMANTQKSAPAVKLEEPVQKKKGADDTSYNSNVADMKKLKDVINAHAAQIDQLFKVKADKAQVFKELSEISEIVDRLEQVKADAHIVARKAEREYVDNALDKLKKELENLLQHTNDTTSNLFAKDLQFLKDIVDGKAERGDIRKIKELIAKLKAEEKSGEGLAGHKPYKCIACNNVVNLRPKPMSMSFSGFVNHLPSPTKRLYPRRQLNNTMGIFKPPRPILQPVHVRISSPQNGSKYSTEPIEGEPTSARGNVLPPIADERDNNRISYSEDDGLHEPDRH